MFRYLLPIALIHLTGAPAAVAQIIDDEGRWHAGAYSYSDELGGFVIRDVSGIGTADDPVVIVQEMNSATPVTLVIRAEGVVRPRTFDSGVVPNGFIHLRIVALNGSGLPWLAFELELQEHYGEASEFGDGLSFDQRHIDSRYIASDRFAEFSRAYEPYDRIRFTGGHTDAGETVTLEIFITDFTPRSQFYLLLDPRIPMA